jgi:methionyl-tRNA formyltransferase
VIGRLDDCAIDLITQSPNHPITQLSSWLNLVFCGTPIFAVPTLDRLVAAGFKVHLVVTQPDRPRGRGYHVSLSPVKQRALELGLPLVQPERIKNDPEFQAQLAALKPDAIIVVGYGRIIPQWMLELPRLGNINLHASLLPKYRGAAPIQWAIARGETVTGVTTMKIDAGLDTGDILLQEEMRIAPDDTSETLAPRLGAVGAHLMVETLKRMQAGSIQPQPQDDAQATLAPILKKEDGEIDFSWPTAEILNRLRGFQPWPGAFTKFRGKNLQVRKAGPARIDLPPGELKIENNHLFVGCGTHSSLEVEELQLEGKKRTSASEFIRGYRLEPGERLGA